MEVTRRPPAAPVASRAASSQALSWVRAPMLQPRPPDIDSSIKSKGSHGRHGTAPYVYKTRRVAVMHVVIGLVIAIFAAIFALAAFPDAGTVSCTSLAASPSVL